MLPPGIEDRPALRMKDDMVALGFSGQHISDRTADQLLGKDFQDYLIRIAEASSIRVVVVDLRNIIHLSVITVARLKVLCDQLQQMGRKVVLLGTSSHCDLIGATQLGKEVSLMTNEAELRAWNDEKPGNNRIGFSASELAQMRADGITLDDAIREIQKLAV